MPSNFQRTKFARGMALRKPSNNPISHLCDRVGIALRTSFVRNVSPFVRREELGLLAAAIKQIIFCKPEHQTTCLKSSMKSTMKESQEIRTWKVVPETLK